MTETISHHSGPAGRLAVWPLLTGALVCLPGVAAAAPGGPSPFFGLLGPLGLGMIVFVAIQVVLIAVLVANRALRVRAEEALGQTEGRYLTLFNGAGDAIFVYDIRGHFLDVNTVALERLGYTRSELLSMSLSGINTPENVALITERMEKLMDRGRHFYETAHVTKDGRVIPTEVNARIIDYGGEPAMLSAARDIAERKRAEKEQSLLEDQLARKHQLECVGRLADGLAHEYNNLLSPIIGFSEMALGNVPEGDPLRNDLGEILGAGQRARDLTRRLQAFSGKQMLDVKVLELSKLVQDFAEMLRHTIREDIEIEYALDPGFWHVKADRYQMEQVLMNLALNAQDAMPEGGVLTIETANMFLDDDYVQAHPGVQPGEHVALVVSDTGRGMDEETLSHLYEPFFSTKEDYAGAGLGLATVHGVIAKHRGSIDVCSEPGRGTTFTICLQRVMASAAREEVASAQGEGGRGSETVVVAEDEVAVRRLACQVIKRHGYAVLEAEDTEHALRLAEKEKGPIHLLVTDVIMPGMNGRQLYERLVLLHPRMKVLYISGHADDVLIRQGVLESKTDLLQKPFSVADLTRRMREVLDR